MSTAKPLEFKYNQGIFPIKHGSIDAFVPIPESALVFYDFRQSNPTKAITELVNRQDQEATDRASSANPRQVNGTLKAYPSGEAALIPGKVGGVLIQGSAATLIENSGLSGVIALIINWSTFGVIDSVQQSNVFSSANSATFLSSSSQNFIQQTIAGIMIGDEFTLSCDIEAISGSISVDNAISMQTPGNFTRQYSFDGVDIPDSFLIPGPGTIDLRITATVAATGFFRIGCGTVSNATGSVTVSIPQLVTGLIASSFILSPIGSTDTRIADNSTISTVNFPNNDFSIEFNYKFNSNAPLQIPFENLQGGVSANNYSIFVVSGGFRFERRNALDTGDVGFSLPVTGDLTGRKFKFTIFQSSSLATSMTATEIGGPYNEINSNAAADFILDVPWNTSASLGSRQGSFPADGVMSTFLLEPIT